MKALTKLVRLIKSFSNDAMDKAYNPVSDLKQAQRDIEAEILNMIKRGTDVITPSRKANEKKANEMSSQASTFLQQASTLKAGGDVGRAKQMIQRHLRVKEMADKYAETTIKQRQQEKRLKEVVKELYMKKDDLTFELEMLEARKDIADTNIHYHEKIEGGSESIQEVIKKAREAVDKIEYKSEALEEWNEDLKDVRGDNDKQATMNAGKDVEELFGTL